MGGLSGPVVATSATGALLALGPPGPPGAQGPQGATGAQGLPGNGWPPWTRVNLAGGGIWLPSGTALTNAQTSVLVDCTSAQAYVLAPPSPLDGQPLLLKDPNGSWVSPSFVAQLLPNTGQVAEPPANPGTKSTAGLKVSCWPQPGSSTLWVYDAVQNAWLLA